MKNIMGKAVLVLITVMLISISCFTNHSIAAESNVGDGSTVIFTRIETVFRSAPDDESGIIINLPKYTSLYYLRDVENDYVEAICNNAVGYVKKDTVVASYEEILQQMAQEGYIMPAETGRLTATKGIAYGPVGKESYYNLDMSMIVCRMQRKAFPGVYWIRQDGCKMYGAFVMVAADFNIFPIGSIVPTTLGPSVVTDTGSFTRNGSGVMFDIATSW